MINTLFGGPSEADLMRAAMEVVHDKEASSCLSSSTSGFHRLSGTRLFALSIPSINCSKLDLMRAAMEVVHDKESDLENKLIAFDNFEQLIEGIPHTRPPYV
jgi:hypothetical protein